MATKSASIKAIELTRSVFESIHGNLGLLKFNIEELTPKNGTKGEESKKWEIVCSFLETLGSSSQSRYRVSVNLNDRTITIKKLSSGQGEAEPDEPEKKFIVTEKKEKGK